MDRPQRRAKSTSRRDQYLTPNQVADRLLVAPVTVRLWASRGLLKSVTTPGGHRRFLATDVEEFTTRRQDLQDTEPGTPSRLLIIDDDEQFTRYLRDLILKRAPGVHIDVALDGFSAGILYEAVRPDVVALDIHMPEMNGIEVCSLLRSTLVGKQLRIVVLSGYLTDENRQQALAAGADVCLPKTTPPALLLQELGLHASAAAV